MFLLRIWCPCFCELPCQCSGDGASIWGKHLHARCQHARVTFMSNPCLSYTESCECLWHSPCLNLSAKRKIISWWWWNWCHLHCRRNSLTTGCVLVINKLKPPRPILLWSILSHTFSMSFIPRCILHLFHVHHSQAVSDWLRAQPYALLQTRCPTSIYHVHGQTLPMFISHRPWVIASSAPLHGSPWPPLLQGRA